MTATTSASAPPGQLHSVDEAVHAIEVGEMVIVVDDDDRENEGDLIVAAARARPEQLAFMIRHTCGIICAPLEQDTALRLDLGAMVPNNDAPLGTAFTVSVDYREGLTTGISADERTNTLRALANGNAGGKDFVRPGHIFPLVAKQGGTLMRAGHTEAAVDLARLAGLPPVGVIAELVNDDGTVKRLPELLTFAAEHGLKIISIADLIAYRQQREKLVERLSEFEVVTRVGPAQGYAYGTDFDHVQHLALVFGKVRGMETVPVRIHRENLLSDVFGAPADNDLILRSMRHFEQAGGGVLLYLREGSAGVPASGLQGTGADAGEGPTPSEAKRVEAWRDIGLGAQILRDLEVTRIHLLASRQLNYVGLDGFGIELTSTELFTES